MGFVNLTEGPDGLRHRAAQFSGQSEEFAGRLSSLLGEIAGIEGSRPWGGDKYGAVFEKSYFQATEGGEYARAVDEQVKELGPEASQIGIALSAGASDYQAEDLRIAGDISGVV